MDNRCVIFIDRLREGHTEKVDETFPAELLDQTDSELAFVEDVIVRGEAYRADKELILHFNVVANAQIPCAICNANVVVPVELDNFYHAEPMEEIKSATFNFIPVLREALILEAPRFVECDSKCSARDEVAKFLKEGADGDNIKPEDGYHPFADLDLK